MRKAIETAVELLPTAGISAFVTTWIWSIIINCPITKLPASHIIRASGIGILLWAFAVLDQYRSSPESWSRRKQFVSPPVNKELLHTKPAGLVFGKDLRSGRYVCQTIDKRGVAHYLIIGGSGSGKSSCSIIPTLLANRDKTVFTIDIKGELSYKTVEYDSEHALVINPNNRRLWGYDPLYMLNTKHPDLITTQQIVETWQQISECLVARNPEEKDPYWSNSARNLLMGLGIYYYKDGNHEFIDIVDRILGTPITEQIDKILAIAKPTTPEYRYLVQFGDLTTDKGKVTLGTIFSNLSNNLTLFSNDQDLRFWLKTNPRRVSPYTLFKDRKSIYLTLKEDKLSAYSGLLKLIVDQMLTEAERQPDISGGKGDCILFILDELPRIMASGKLNSLLSGTKTLRSKGVILVMVTQSVSSLTQAFSKSETDDLINNCEYILCLSCKDPSTAKMISAWCGKYLERSISRQGTTMSYKATTSYQDKPLVTEDQLLTLQDSGNAILISPHGYNLIRKTPYYEDKAFRNINQQIQQHNDEYLELQNSIYT